MKNLTLPTGRQAQIPIAIGTHSFSKERKENSYYRKHAPYCIPILIHNCKSMVA